MKYLVFTVLFCTSLQIFAQKLVPVGLNDVSYLYPLPESVNQNKLLRSTDLLDQAILKRFPRLSIRYTNEEIFPKIHAVAVRIDPFHKQIRTVWQPVVAGSQNSTSTLDMAFHSFHQLNEIEFQELFQKLMAWKNKNTKIVSFDFLPLQVHPLLNNQDTALNDLNEIFQVYMTSEKLVKITAMVLRGNDDMWAFMGLEKNEEGVLKPVIIARTANQQVQTFINPAIPFDHFDQAEMSGVTPETEDNLNVFLKKASLNPTLTEDEVRASLNTSFKIENPRLVSEEQMDCVHCHIVDTSRAYISKYYPQIFQTLQSEFEYKNKDLNLENKTTEPLNTRQIRGLGYFGSHLAISQRVINDSADVISRWPF